MHHVYLYLPPRALLVMGGEARYCWQHYIPHRKADWVNGCQVARSSRRVSLTFRKVRAFMQSLPPHCVVADVGCGNGKYFGVRRDLAVLGSDRSPGLAAVAAQRLTLGRAASAAAAAAGPGGSGDLAASPAADVLVADALQLPYRPCSCDGVLCIAVLHHISSRRRRRYYHLFERGELEMLIGEVPGVQVVDGFYDRSN
eukprot:gene1103-1439_t